ncbi:MAG: hybrid sensor histidine kinase/response regulator [Candidatus Kapabacteria bacterium]|jgi:two-component system sensor histidine kinase/response regulator|nr:hybrid sensor histidine kinase/response regulator [Candidatus Kapabacteria bacterium]
MFNINVLVVDDEVNMLSGMQRVISRYTMNLNEIDSPITFTVKTVETAEAALEIMQRFEPDILLLDQNLPGMSGLDLLSQITDGDYSFLTIMVTAYATLETAISSIKSGAFDFLPKPFTPKELRSAVSKAAQKLIMERRVIQLQDEKKKVRFQFISVLGHELKAPLNAIEGYLYMVKDRVAGEEVVSYDKMVDRCQNRIGDMKMLVADLLEMTKIESGERKREFENIDICAVAQESIETMLPDAQKRNIVINTHYNSPIMMNADSEEIQMILNNLISNAVKYNKDDGTVDISISESHGTISIEVKDSGIGLSEDEAAKLFKDFARIKKTETRNIAGSGLGLSTIKKIAQLYNGDITLKSKPGEGSTFRAELISQVLDSEELKS